MFRNVRQTSDSGRALPDGPKGVPLLGVLPWFLRDPIGLVSETMKYGDVVRLTVPMLDVFLLNDPDGLQQVLQRHASRYEKSRNYAGLKLVLGHGLLTSEGSFHKRQRRLAQPAFHQRHMRAFGDAMIRHTARMLDRWDRDPSASFDVAAEMMRLTLGIVGETLFSTDVEGDAKPVGDALTVALHFADSYVTSVAPLPTWVPTPKNRAFNQALKTLDEVVYRIIAQRRDLLKSAPDEGPADLLGLLLSAVDEDGERMDDKQLRDEIMTLVLAGHETTANTLAWAFALLGRHPTVERQVATEVADVIGEREQLAYEDVPKLRYTDQVLSETLRLYPPAWSFERQALEDDVVGGYAFPKGTVFACCAYTLHRNPKYWSNPEGFDPDRFSPENTAAMHKFAYLPFGAGPRICIGKGFAMMEAKIILAMILQRYRLELVPGHRIEPEARITMRPKHGVIVSKHAR